ncbi:hypothetical protein BYT27DRAFT_7112950 [Phlegmacium glaucopus]|nr:hypothetical protein BYT27DRAFT_7112950 [Phlegmacium glaucopus]
MPDTEILDIEHVPVQNDPRKWSPLSKNATLASIASASMIAGLSCNIQNHEYVWSISHSAVQEMEAQLPATPEQFSLSILLFVLIQGVMPLFWCAVSKVKG